MINLSSKFILFSPAVIFYWLKKKQKTASLLFFSNITITINNINNIWIKNKNKNNIFSKSLIIKIEHTRLVNMDFIPSFLNYNRTKMKFSIDNFFSKTRCGSYRIYKRSRDGKLHFLCSFCRFFAKYFIHNHCFQAIWLVWRDRKQDCSKPNCRDKQKMSHKLYPKNTSRTMHFVNCGICFRNFLYAEVAFRTCLRKIFMNKKITESFLSKFWRLYGSNFSKMWTPPNMFSKKYVFYVF